MIHGLRWIVKLVVFHVPFPASDRYHADMRHSLLRVHIDGITKADALRRLGSMLGEQRGHMVTTPNPEMLVAASKDGHFRNALNTADLALPDGFGLLLVGLLKGMRIPERITGTDVVDDLCRLAAEQGRSVFFLGGEASQVAERAAAVLAARHPGLKVAGAVSGCRVFWHDEATPVIEGDALVRLKSAAPDILFVAFGHRKQELWIRNSLSSLPSVRIAIGVGGAFDFIAGDVKRAPIVMRRLGLEWLWRLAIEPRKRLMRIWNAVFVFPYLAFFAK